MGLLRPLLIFLTVMNFLSASENHILYSLKRGLTNHAIKAYQETFPTHNSELLEQIATQVITEGLLSKDPEKQMMAIFGAGISLNENMLSLLEQGLSSNTPEIQLASLSYLARFQNDLADQAIARAMGSNYLRVRLEAALFLAEKRAPKVFDQTSALMSKIPPKLHMVFPEIFAVIGTDEAKKELRKFLVSPFDSVRIEAIRSIAKHGRDDLIEKVRLLATHHNLAEQEVCAEALGILKDEQSAPQLEKLTNANTLPIRLAAMNALFRLGRKEMQEQVERYAKHENLFAIRTLGKMPGSEETLLELAKSPNQQVKTNAIVSLLELQDERCLPYLGPLLIQGPSDIALSLTSSLGGTLSAFKVVPSAAEKLKDQPEALGLSLHLKEMLLAKVANFPENTFLEFAKVIFQSNQNQLIPTLVHLLENMQSTKSIELLKVYQQKAGAPLIRNYCNLALFRLNEPGPYLSNLKRFVKEQQKEELIRFRAANQEGNKIDTHFQITPEETSRLLIEAFEAIAQMQEKESIDIILNAILEGNENNKYALAGLLIRAAQ